MVQLLRHGGRLMATELPQDLDGVPLGCSVLDPWAWRWRPMAEGSEPVGETVSAAEALKWLHRERLCRLVPVAVVGPRDPVQASLETARVLGRALGELGIPILCGGKTGVMKAVSEAASRAGSLVIGMIPDNEWEAANPFVTLPLATGLGPARNVLIARACVAMVAVGGQYGTITEVAYALHFQKRVFGLAGAPEIPGVEHARAVPDVVAALLPVLLRLPVGARLEARVPPAPYEK